MSSRLRNRRRRIDDASNRVKHSDAPYAASGCVQAWGLGLPGKAGPFWCTQTPDVHWFAGHVLVGQTLRLLAPESGKYQEVRERARAGGYVIPEVGRQIRRAM